MAYTGGQRCDGTRAGEDRHRPGEGSVICHRLADSECAGWVLDIHVFGVAAGCRSQRTEIPGYAAVCIATAVVGGHKHRPGWQGIGQDDIAQIDIAGSGAGLDLINDILAQRRAGPAGQAGLGERPGIGGSGGHGHRIAGHRRRPAGAHTGGIDRRRAIGGGASGKFYA